MEEELKLEIDRLFRLVDKNNGEEEYNVEED